MSEEPKRLHLDLYKQNLGKDNISVSKVGQFTVPGVVIKAVRLAPADAELLKKTVELDDGDLSLYLSFKNKTIYLGKIYLTSKVYFSIKNAIDGSTLYMIEKDDTSKAGLKLTELTEEDVACTMTLAEKHLEDYPELHKEFLLDNYKIYKRIIAKNYYLDPLSVKREQLEEIASKEVAEKIHSASTFEVHDSSEYKLPGLFYDFINERKDEFKKYIDFETGNIKQFL